MNILTTPTSEYIAPQAAPFLPMGFETHYFHTYICMIAYLADNRVVAP
jgi:hypothetical protein